MPVLTPISWVLVIAAFLQIVTGFGWWVTSTKLDNAYAKLTQCEAKHKAFVEHTEYLAKEAQKKAEEVKAENERIANETARGWSAALAYVRADADKRLRYANRNSGSGSVSAQGITAPRTDEPAQVDLPSAERVIADCAEDTLTLVWLQDWVKRTSQ